jgi:hypothetical protein
MGKTLLEYASGRLEEVDQLSRETDDAETISETLQTFTDQANEASELLLSDYAETGKRDSVEELRDFTADSMSALTALETLVPEDARASLIQAAQTLTQIDQQALLACPTCGPALITEIPSFTNVALNELLGSVTETLQADQTPAADRRERPVKDTRKSEGDEVDPPVTTSTSGPSTKPGKKDGLIKDLTDELTGSGKDKQDDDDKGLLDSLNDGLEGLTGGLLGN